MKRREFLKKSIGTSAALGGLYPFSSAHAWNAARMRKARRTDTVIEAAIDELTRLNLTSNLQMCYDAGDSNSIQGASPQIWYDTSGNGLNACFGTNSSGSTNDPSFSGTVGALTSNEYIFYDGSAFLRPDSGSSPAWVESLHHDNVQFTFVTWAYFANTTGTQSLFGTRNGPTNTGVRWNLDSDATMRFYVSNAGNTNLDSSSTLTGISAGWGMYAISMSVSGGSYSVIHHINGASNSGSGSYAGPIGSGPATYKFEIGAAGGGGARMDNGGRIAMFMGWYGQSLTTSQLNGIFEKTRGRFGV